MRARFLAAAGRPEELDRLRQGIACDALRNSGLTPALDTNELILFTCASSPVLHLSDERGVLIGTLFERGSADRVRELSAGVSEAALRSAGASLLDGHWGSYVLLLRLDAGGHAVLRDPSGAVPVYFFAAEGLSLYCSDVAVPVEAGLIAPSPDLEFARNWLAFPHLRTSRTGLQGIEELLPGTRRHAGTGTERIKTAWTPWDYASRDRQLDGFDKAAAAVRAETLRTVPRHAAPGEKILLQLSGGLDSSIVAVALHAGGVEFEAVNYFTRSADGDERRYARAASAAARASLAELLEDDRPLDLSVPGTRRARPGPNPVLQPLHRAIAAHAASTGADAILDGAGGDNLFCYLTTAAPALDAGRVLGFGAALRTLRDISELCGCTVWTAARAAARKQWRGAKRPYWKRDASFLMLGAVSELPDRHPWLEAPEDALPGKREHVEALVSIQHFLDRGIEIADVPLVRPLLAQPLLEICLRIPTWLWVRDGRNRAVARAAFADLLPSDLVNRRSKGRLESLFAKSFARNRADLQALLLGGELRREGLIDAASIEAYLRGRSEPQDQGYIRLFEIAALELWLRSWRR